MHHLRKNIRKSYLFEYMMGANFSLIVVRIINKSKRSKSSKEKLNSKDERKDLGNENIEKSLPPPSRRSTIDSAVSSDNESDGRINIITGTSNHHFYKFRSQKRVCKIILIFNNGIIE